MNPMQAMAEQIQKTSQAASEKRHEQLLVVLREILAELKKLSEGA
jgi:hypothetical protein